MSMYQNHVISTNNESRTSPFGVRVRNGIKEMHNGIDFVDADRREKTGAGVDIICYSDGEVVAVGKDKAKGNYVTVAHQKGYLTDYRHLRDLGISASRSQLVRQGQKLGVMGATGDSSGIHLHFAVKINSSNISNGDYVDPEPYIIGTKNFGSIVPPGKPPAAAGTLKVGDTIRIRPSAERYVTGEIIPARLKGAVDEIMQLGETSRNPAVRAADAVLLKYIYSWVKKSDVEKI